MSLQEVDPDEIKFHFDNIQAFNLSGKLVEECIKICQDYRLSAEELVGEWEAFAFNSKKKHVIETPTSAGLQEYVVSKMQQKQYEKYQDSNIKREILAEEEIKPIMEAKIGEKRKPTFDDEDEMEIKEEQPKKKEVKKVQGEGIEEEILLSSKSGRITHLYNEKLSDTIQRDPLSQPKYTFPYLVTKRLQPKTVRYMNEEPGTRVTNFDLLSLDTRKRLETELVSENVIELKGGADKVELLITEKLEPFHLFLQSQVITIARVGKETLGDGEIQIYIEGSHANQIVRTPLHFEKVKAYSFFPGLTVALRGNNPASKLFRASAVRYPQPLPAFPVKPSNFATSIIVASGPFSSQKSLSYHPLQQLLNQVKEKKPDFLIINGPFVDERHPMVQTGTIEYKGIDYSCDQWFKSQLDEILDAVEQLPTLVFIIPSQFDLHHPYCIYPQPKFNVYHPLLGTKLFFMDDPSTITINDQQVTIGVTSVDTLMHLASEEIRKGTTDRISLLLSHLLEQGNFYPLYPPKEGFCVDSKMTHKLQMRKYAPNILITPSDFVPFAKVVGQTLCINPGRTAKGNDGTIAHIIVHPHDDTNLLSHVKVDLINV